MREVFLVEPMGDRRLFAALTGATLPDASVAAVLDGHAIAAAKGGLRLGAVRRAGARAPGRVVALDRDARARLEFWMETIGAAALVAAVEAEDGRRVVDTFILPATVEIARDWDRAAWDGEWHDLVCEAAEEVAGLIGHHEARRMPALLQGIAFRAVGRARGRRTETPVALRSAHGRADVEELSRDPVYTNYFSVTEYMLRFRRFDGGFSPAVNRAVFASGDAIMVLPYDPARDAVLLIEQFRCGPFARRDPSPWALEAVAGRCDPLETPEATLRREAREEAGLTLGRIERIGAYYASIGLLSEHITAFVGEADLSGVEGRFGLASEEEDIRTMVVPLRDALEAVANGEVNNAPPIIALLWLEKHAPRLRAAWGGA